jgi:glycosyltransferase involved in cell wall biosynthesis
MGTRAKRGCCLGIMALRIGGTMKISVLIPVYNECETFEVLLDQVRAVEIDGEKEIVMVDDFSTDGTRELLKELGEKDDSLKILYHEVNQGKGAALQTGFEATTGDIVIIQDADLEYDPAEYPALLGPILCGKADVVYGSRFLGGQPHRVLYFWHSLGNRFLTLLSNMCTNLNLTDMETCYKVFRREVMEGMTIRSQRFGFEPEFTAKIAKNRWRVFEMPISYNGRTYEEGKKITWKDGFSAIHKIIYFRLFD